MFFAFVCVSVILAAVVVWFVLQKPVADVVLAIRVALGFTPAVCSNPSHALE